MYQTLQTVGSFCGLFAFGFSAFERLFKGRPIASVSSKQNGQGLSPSIRITNISHYDIAVLGIKVKPDVYRIALSDTPKDLLRASFGQSVEFILPPGAAREVFLARGPTQARPRPEGGYSLDGIKNQRLRITIFWRRGNITWLPQIPVWVWTSTSFIIERSKEQSDGLDEVKI